MNLPPLTPRTQLVDPKTGLPTAQFIDFWQQIRTAINDAGGTASSAMPSFALSMDFAFSNDTLDLATDFVESLTLSGALAGEITGRDLILYSPTLSVQQDGTLVTAPANNLDFTGLITVADDGTTAIIRGNGPEFIYAGATFPDIETINLQGDLSITTGIAPSIVQTGTLFYQGVTENLVMTTAPTFGNYLVLFIVNNGQYDTNPQPGLLPGWTQVAYVGINGTFHTVMVTKVDTTTGNAFPIYISNGPLFNVSAVCHEIANASSFGLQTGPINPSIVVPNLTSGTGTTVTADALNAGSSPVPILAYGAFIATGNYANPTTSFSSALPVGVELLTTVPCGGYDGEYANYGQDLCYIGAPENISFGLSATNNIQQFIGLVFYGLPTPNFINLIGTPTLVVDGITILPTIQTAGMLEFSEPDTLGAYLTIEAAGTVQNTLATALNFAGAGATVSGTGAVETINIPGVNFSGTNITEIIPGPGVSGTVISSTLTIAASGGGGGGGGINFAQLTAPTSLQTLLVYPVGSSGLTLSSGLPGASAYAETAPTGAVVITLYKNSTAIGTINWAAGSNVGTFLFTSSITFANSDVLTAKFQTTLDATFANFGVVLVPTDGAGSLQTFYASSTTTQSISGGSDVAVSGCSMTIPASSVQRVFAVSFNCLCTGATSGENNGQIRLDGSSNHGIAYFTSDGANRAVAVSATVTVPGDNAAHTIDGTVFLTPGGATYGNPFMPSISAIQVG